MPTRPADARWLPAGSVGLLAGITAHSAPVTRQAARAGAVTVTDVMALP